MHWADLAQWYHWAYTGAVSAFRHIRSRPHQSQNPDRKSEQFEKFRVFILKIPLTVHTLLRAPPMPFECQETVPFIHQKRQWHSDRQTIFSPMPMVLSRSISYIKCKRFEEKWYPGKSGMPRVCTTRTWKDHLLYKLCQARSVHSKASVDCKKTAIL